jgi:hypothetical protein
MHIYLLRDIEEKELDRMQALMPGLRAVTGQLDYILSSEDPGQAQLGQQIAESQKMMYFISASKACAPGGSAERLIKEFNRLIGKESVLAVAAADVWEQIVRLLCGQNSAVDPAEPFTLAHIHVKGFPAPGGGVLQAVLCEQDVLARAGDCNS